MTNKRRAKPLVSRNPQKPLESAAKLASRKTLAHMNLRGNESSAPAQRSNSDAYTARRALGDDERSGLLLLGTSACEARG